jgi:hypothetical protein
MNNGIAVCRRCKKEPASPGKANCDGCREYAKKIYEKQVSNGLCPVCCTNETAKGRTVCESCRHKQRTAYIRALGAGHCVKCRKAHDEATSWCRSCLDKQRAHHKQLRDDVFAAYGGYHCACCGEPEPVFLEIDHINNDGAAHRKLLKGGGRHLYNWLRTNKYPPGFQVLCANCNRAKRFGICPHQLSKEAPQCLPQPETAEAK